MGREWRIITDIRISEKNIKIKITRIFGVIFSDFSEFSIESICVHLAIIKMTKYTYWTTVIFATVIITFLFGLIIETTATIAQPKAPNFQYFERPKYRYPYYDENGRGKLLYGYGGPELYQYKTYSGLEGIH